MATPKVAPGPVTAALCTGQGQEPGSSPAPPLLNCVLGQIPSPLWASLFLFVKWPYNPCSGTRTSLDFQECNSTNWGLDKGQAFGCNGSFAGKDLCQGDAPASVTIVKTKNNQMPKWKILQMLKILFAKCSTQEKTHQI